MKYATVLIGTPKSAKNNQVDVVLAVAPSLIIQSPLEISTYPSINIPLISDIYSPALFLIQESIGLLTPLIIAEL